MSNSNDKKRENTITNTSPTDFSEKTSVMSGDTFSGRLKETPPAAVVILVGPTNYIGKQWTLTKSQMIIGRQIDCDIFIDDKSVSRTHAKISVTQSTTIIEDLESSNKTSINGKTLEPNVPVELLDNDQIKAGSVVFRYLAKGNLMTVAAQELADKAQKDAMTGAFTKGALMERGPELFRRAEVLSEAMSVVVFDIDHFKLVNDTYGHAAGDFILTQMAKVVSHKVVRGQDYFARYGGEEFVLILSNSSLPQATEIGERLRQTVEAAEFRFETKHIPITISVGVAQKQDGDTSWSSIFERADSALYSSKKSGRNRVTFY